MTMLRFAQTLPLSGSLLRSRTEYVANFLPFFLQPPAKRNCVHRSKEAPTCAQRRVLPVLVHARRFLRRWRGGCSWRRLNENDVVAREHYPIPRILKSIPIYI